MKNIKSSQYYFNKIKPVILYFFEYKCINCGVVSFQNEVHHLDHNHKNNNVFNLVVVCNNCHKIIHKSSISLKWDVSDVIFKKMVKFDKVLSDLFK